LFISVWAKLESLREHLPNNFYSEGLKLIGALEVVVVLVLFFFGVSALILLAILLRHLDGALTSITRVIYYQGNSSEAFLLKVIISIIFPPIFFYFIWVLLKDIFGPPMSDATEEEQAVAKREARESDARKLENAKMWSGQHGGVVVLGEIPVLEDSTVVAIQAAADAGDASAQFELGLMYMNGEGTPQDYKLAHMWFNLAAVTGDEDAVKGIDMVAEQMTSEDIALAQQMAKKWLDAHSSAQ
jgi:hypothetical protein